MIRKLTIKNYAIIEHLEINFSDNLTIITGETGAGKSIMMGGLGLIMGKRADSKTLFNKNNKCVIEGVFDVSMYRLKEFFDVNDLDYEEETFLRREITPNGKSRAFVNDTPVLLSTLKELSDKLIDLHQQFDTLDIHDALYQIKVIDSIANNKALLDEYQSAYKKHLISKKELNALFRKRIDAKKESDFLLYQFNELSDAHISEGEVERLESEQKCLVNAEDIQRVLGGAALQIVENDSGICNQMSEVSNAVSKLIDFYPNLKQLLGHFDSMLLELQEIGNEFLRITESTEHNPDRLTEINDRLSVLYTLLSKYHVRSDAELIDIKNKLQQSIGNNEDLDSKIESLEVLVLKQEKKLRKLALKLSANRKKVVGKFQKSVHGLLAQLSMEHAQLFVEITPASEFMPTGIDDLKFLFAANKGSRPEEIKGIASGGELSRLALCIKSLVASAIPLPSLVFDEIDTGVSGVVALQMGGILQQLSRSHQVITITHSPQIAAKANKHYFVRKKVEGNKTSTFVSQLNAEERILEIAKMLSGNPPSEVAKENARELLGSS